MKKSYNSGIDFMDLFVSIVKKWKSVVLIILICACLAGCFGLYKSKQTLPEASNEIEALKATLTEEEVNDVNNSASVINSFREKYNVQKEYVENSIYQSLNPYSIDTLVLNYYVDNDYQVSYPNIEKSNNVISIIQTYKALLSDVGLYEAISKEFDNSIKPEYFQEVVSVDTEDEADGVFIVKIYATNNEMLDKMCAVIIEGLESSYSTIAETCGSHKLLLSSKTYQKTVDSDMVKDQQENLSNLSNIGKYISAEELKYSGDQLTYLQVLIHEKIEVDVSVEKYIIIGAFVGLFVALVFFILKYVVSSKLKMAKEMRQLFGIDILATANVDVAGSDKLLSAKLNSIIGNRNYKSVVLSVDANVTNFDYVELVARNIDIAKITVIKNVLKDVDGIKKISDADAVILIEEVNYSTYQEIEDTIRFFNNNCKEIIGTVVFDD